MDASGSLDSSASLITAFIPVIGSTHDQGGVTDCVAPCAVEFEVQTSAGVPAIDADFVDPTYIWDFGDSECRTNTEIWPYSGKSKCEDSGPIAGHVFAPGPGFGSTPKTYIVNLTMLDNGATAQATRTVRIHDPDSHFAGTNTVCFSKNGVFSGCPAGASQITTTQSDTFNGLLAGLAAKRYLFHRGETWNATGKVRLNLPGPGQIGAYGSGGRSANPRITLSANLILFNFYIGNKDWRITDLKVELGPSGIGTATGGFGISDSNSSQIKELLALRVDMDGLPNPIKIKGKKLAAAGNPHEDLAFIDCKSLNRTWPSTGPSSNDFFGSADHLLFMGNDFGDVSFTTLNASHLLRFTFLNAGVISHNTLGRKLGDQTHVIKLHNDTNGAPKTARILIANNIIEGGPSDPIVDIGPQSNRTVYEKECVENTIFESNIIRFGRAGFKTGQTLLRMEGGKVNAIRNNIFDLTDGHAFGVFAINIKTRVSTQVCKPDRTRIYNNTCFTDIDGNKSGSGANYTCIKLNNSRVVDNIIKNNFIYSANPSANNVIPVTDFGAGTIKANNIKVTSNPFVTVAPFSFLDFRLDNASSVASQLIDIANTCLPFLPFDLSGTPRPIGSSCDLGAFEFGVPLSIVDSDLDGIQDANDNCTLKANPDQHDSDNDGFGNLCDGDFNNNNFTNNQDFILFGQHMGTFLGDGGQYDPQYDFDLSGSVSNQDFIYFRGELFGKPPGPSGEL